MVETAGRDEGGSVAVLFALLPGPDRKRTAHPYAYRVTYRNPEAGAGCVVLWEVTGGRMAYQVALERDEVGNLTVHCTCADHVFRAEQEGRFCKHVVGLLDFVGQGNGSPAPLLAGARRGA
jgi:hypothetical protein